MLTNKLLLQTVEDDEDLVPIMPEDYQPETSNKPEDILNIPKDMATLLANYLRTNLCRELVQVRFVFHFTLYFILL